MGAVVVVVAQTSAGVGRSFLSIVAAAFPATNDTPVLEDQRGEVMILILVLGNDGLISFKPDNDWGHWFQVASFLSDVQ